MVECSPATRAARVRFPADATFFSLVFPFSEFFYPCSFISMPKLFNNLLFFVRIRLNNFSHMDVTNKHISKTEGVYFLAIQVAQEEEVDMAVAQDTGERTLDTELLLF